MFIYKIAHEHQTALHIQRTDGLYLDTVSEKDYDFSNRLLLRQF